MSDTELRNQLLLFFIAGALLSVAVVVPNPNLLFGWVGVVLASCFPGPLL